jgi:phosphinothricin acetyltransferase
MLFSLHGYELPVRLVCFAGDRNPYMIHVRPATQADLPEITEIYNEAILSTPATFDTEIKTVDERRTWLASHGGLYPVLVAEEDARILGWGSLSPMGSRPGWRYTVEDSVYVRERDRGRGVGRALLEALVREARSLGHHSVVARITSCNRPSIHLHRTLGFQPAGTWHEVGRKFDAWLDLVNMALVFDPGSPPAQER